MGLARFAEHFRTAIRGLYEPVRGRQRARQFRNFQAPRRFEKLEPRLALSSDGIVWGNSAYLTLSFAPDGTDVAGQPSALFSTFDEVAQSEVWQEAVQQAFQTWAVHTNADIGVVADSGDPFGAAGRTHADSRFGDIRVGAIPMREGVFAISIPQDIVSGTWVGDVVFNSNADLADVHDIFSVALHEAGNVFGLKDNQDPNSPLYSGGVIPTASQPTPADVAALEAIFGVRAADTNERDRPNDTFGEATHIRFSDDEGFQGETPSVLYGDIASVEDVDVFRLDIPNGYTGPVTLEVRTQGISLLAPRLSAFDRDGNSLDVQESLVGGRGVSIQLPQVDSDQRFYVQVEGSTDDVFAVGGYSLISTFDEALQTSRGTIDLAASGQFRFLEQDDIQEFFAPESNEDVPLFYVDNHQDDTDQDAAQLDTSPGFVESTRYNTVGSISDRFDLDVYRITSAKADAGNPNIMTVVVRALDGPELVSGVTAIDRHGNQVPGQIVVHEGGDHVVQFSNIEPDQQYFIRIEPIGSEASFHAGNYELTVTFGDKTIELEEFATGQLTAEQPHRLHGFEVTQNQMIHFVLETTPADAATGGVTLNILSPDGEQVLQITSATGETRSQSSVFLAPGLHAIEILADVTPTSILQYRLLGITISDPLAVPPDDSVNDPIVDCPGLDPDFCFPGDADLDLDVDFADFVILANNFGLTNRTWRNGDFDGDTRVDFADFTILANNYGQQLAPLPPRAAASPPILPDREPETAPTVVGGNIS